MKKLVIKKRNKSFFFLSFNLVIFIFILCDKTKKRCYKISIFPLLLDNYLSPISNKDSPKGKHLVKSSVLDVKVICDLLG